MRTPVGNPHLLRRHRHLRRGITSIVAIFSLLVLIMLCLLTASLIATGSEEARSLLRAKQSFFLGDAGTDIAKQLVVDNGPNWRPWTGSSYQCPAGWTGGANTGTCHYCAGAMTIGNVTGTIKLYVCTKGSTTGNINAPCTDAPVGVDIDVMGIGTLSGA